MIRFKQLKYKHVQRARELLAKIEQNQTDQTEMDKFVFPLVADWDFTDIETGQPIPPGQPDELTIEQYNELYEAFNTQMSGDSTVKKTSESP